MARHKGTVLVDTNVIIECWRTSSWKALVGGYDVETVHLCEAESLTGTRSQIDPQVLRQTLNASHAVSEAERAAAFVKDNHFGVLDAGEAHLWAHALTRADAWVLCGPDKASMRYGLRVGARDRLVSLERLLTDAGLNPKIKLKNNYSQKWHELALAQLSQEEKL